MTGTDVLKRLYYPLYHRVRNRDTLTAAMFHRVLGRADARYESALPDWTISDDLFDACLRFFTRHYNVVSLEQVLASLRGAGTLPPRSLLITFDDGYADNEEYALPLLRKYGVPAVLFVFSDAIGSRTRPWADDLQFAYLRGSVSADDLAAIYRWLYAEDTADNPPAGPQALLAAVFERANEVPLSDVERFLSQRARPVPVERRGEPPQMLSVAQLRRLRENGVEVGAHGKTHTAFTRAGDLDTELREPRRALPRALGLGPTHAIQALAFPYGAYDERVLERSWQEGYELVFTIQPHIAPLSRGRLTTRVLGRLNAHGPTIAADGVLRFEQIAYAFFRAPHARAASMSPLDRRASRPDPPQ